MITRELAGTGNRAELRSEQLAVMNAISKPDEPSLVYFRIK
jgi:hypothetical protein